MTLDRGALTLATIEYPGLELEASLRTLDVLAGEVQGRTRTAQNGYEFIQGANQFLFHEMGFRGNAQDYYNPHNSCLNEVLKERSGIPISLSVIYLEIARRLQRPVFGIALPGHFLVQYNDGQYATFIDPFQAGALLSADDCYQMASLKYPDPRVLEPVDKRHILFRMINNLRGIYSSRRLYRKALQVMDLLVDATPELADHYKQRAMLHTQLQQMGAARADLERYLAMVPDAEDREEREAQLRGAVRWLASLN
jgi:regulator of sirC expression with transglutaminase-like and TPR domain